MLYIIVFSMLYFIILGSLNKMMLIEPKYSEIKGKYYHN